MSIVEADLVTLPAINYCLRKTAGRRQFVFIAGAKTYRRVARAERERGAKNRTREDAREIEEGAVVDFDNACVKQAALERDFHFRDVKITDAFFLMEKNSSVIRVFKDKKL